MINVCNFVFVYVIMYDYIPFMSLTVTSEVRTNLQNESLVERIPLNIISPIDIFSVIPLPERFHHNYLGVASINGLSTDLSQ